MCPWQKSDKLERSQGSDYPPGVTVHGHQLPNLGEGERMVQPTRHTDFCKNRNTPRHQGANPPWGNSTKRSSRSGQIQLALKRQCGSVVKNPPAKQEMQVRSLDQKDPLEKEMAAHSRILAWRIPWTEEPGRLQSVGVTKQPDTTERLDDEKIMIVDSHAGPLTMIGKSPLWQRQQITSFP